MYILCICKDLHVLSTGKYMYCFSNCLYNCPFVPDSSGLTTGSCCRSPNGRNKRYLVLIKISVVTPCRNGHFNSAGVIEKS